MATRGAESELDRLTRLLLPRLPGAGLAELTAEQVEALGTDGPSPREQVAAAAARSVRAAEELAGRHGIAVGELDLPLFSALYAAGRAEPDRVGFQKSA